MKWLIKNIGGYVRFKNIFSLIVKDGKIEICEECDQCFIEILEPAEAIEMFQEAIDWIKENCEVNNA